MSQVFSKIRLFIYFASCLFSFQAFSRDATDNIKFFQAIAPANGKGDQNVNVFEQFFQRQDRVNQTQPRLSVINNFLFQRDPDGVIRKLLFIDRFTGRLYYRPVLIDPVSNFIRPVGAFAFQYYRFYGGIGYVNEEPREVTDFYLRNFQTFNDDIFNAFKNLRASFNADQRRKAIDDVIKAIDNRNVVVRYLKTALSQMPDDLVINYDEMVDMEPESKSWPGGWKDAALAMGLNFLSIYRKDYLTSQDFVPTLGTPSDKKLVRVNRFNQFFDKNQIAILKLNNPYACTKKMKNGYTYYDDAREKPRLDWFLKNAYDQENYNAIMKLPDNYEDYARQINYSSSRADELVRNGTNFVTKGKIDNSGSPVEYPERMLNYDARSGAWRSHDQFSTLAGRIVNKARDLFDIRPGAFTWQAIEKYRRLPNGLLQFALYNFNGKLQKTSAPPEAAQGPSGNPHAGNPHGKGGPAIVNGVGCMSCHLGGVRSVGEEYTPNFDFLSARYPDYFTPQRSWQSIGQRFNFAYKNAVKTALSGNVDKSNKPHAPYINKIVEKYSKPLTMNEVAKELKFVGENTLLVKWINQIRKTSTLGDNQVISRQDFEIIYCALKAKVGQYADGESAASYRSIGSHVLPTPTY